jgi:hypothetical protein
LEAAGRKDLLAAHREVTDGQLLEARRILLQLESRYMPSRLGFEARSQRAELENRPTLLARVTPEDRAGPTGPDERAWRRLKHLASRGRIADVARNANTFLEQFPASPRQRDVRELRARLAGPPHANTERNAP